MAKTQYHVNDKGEPGVCQAVYQCKFKRSEDEHYNSPEEARAAYEEKMEKEIFSKKLNANELNKVVKETSDPAVLETASQTGGKRVMKSIMSNKHATEKALREVNRHEWNEADTNTLHSHPNFPVDDLTTEQLVKVVKHAPYGRSKDRYYKSDSIDDAKAEALVKARPNDITPRAEMLVNKNNKISDRTRQDLALHDRNTWMRTIRAGILPKETFHSMDAVELGNVSTFVRDETDADVVHEYTKAALEKDSYLSVADYANNKNVKSETLDLLVDNDSAGAGSRELLYQHPNLSNKSRQKLVESSPRLQSLDKLRAFGQEDGRNLSVDEVRDALIVDDQKTGENRNGTFKEFTKQLDKKKVNDIGLSNDDVVNIYGYGYNAGAVYNSETGVFKGRIDSSG